MWCGVGDGGGRGEMRVVVAKGRGLRGGGGVEMGEGGPRHTSGLCVV